MPPGEAPAPPGEVSALLEGVRASAARFGAAVGALSDAQARGPSRLPGWSRAHLVTHVARSADVYHWLLELARTGTEPGPRADAPTLDRLLREGAGRDAAALGADLRESLDRLVEEATAGPAERWLVLVTALAGWRHPAWYVLCRAQRELEVHLVDLGVGHPAARWPADFVGRELDEAAAALGARRFPLAGMHATDLGRTWRPAEAEPEPEPEPEAGPQAGTVVSAPGHALLGWLAGRIPPERLHSTGPLPVPPRWPLPPAPGWG
ncbi:maleylpyruvate isomerase family mycothiol-dependent enzyme [Kitasatospora sp. NPDC051705]|uniref:maleylpyruvate isomerase family mycothiol-dependent enzyme n=1 Tax=Kitasatospora sp. NPDC051705 TaxID=3364057 RepID=UPI0037897FFE